MNEKYVPPSYGEQSFNCPHCFTYTHQEWFEVRINDDKEPEVTGDLRTFNRIILEPEYGGRGFQENGYLFNNLNAMSKCYTCENPSLWIKGRIVYPQTTAAPLPNPDMPEDVKNIYNEARTISALSPQAAAALLRLALEKLLPQIGAKKSSIDKMIGELVKIGLPSVIQKALDSIRVIGNDAVHAGTIDLRDDTETATLLFKLLNMAVDSMITQKREVDEIYNLLPQNKRDGIANRDKDSSA